MEIVVAVAVVVVAVSAVEKSAQVFVEVVVSMVRCHLAFVAVHLEVVLLVVLVEIAGSVQPAVVLVVLVGL